MPAFGTVPNEVPRESSTSGLAPKFRAQLDAVIDDMRLAGYDAVVFETLRTDERQKFIHGFGRLYDDGRGIVTHSADADETWHGFGLAADIVSRSRLWNAPDEFWKKLHQVARAHGLRSGADWDNDGVMDDWDKPHVQPAGLRRSPSPKAARLQTDGGNQAVWVEVGLAA
jgi:hypothetical protein